MPDLITGGKRPQRTAYCAVSAFPCTVEQAAGAQPETAEMRFDPSGTLTLLVGSTPHGQGHETIYKQLIAEKLAIDPANIRVIEGDTDKVSFGTGTGGSQDRRIGTSAVFEAIGVVDKTLKVAANLLEASDTDMNLLVAALHVSGTDKSISFTEVRAKHLPASKNSRWNGTWPLWRSRQL